MRTKVISQHTFINIPADTFPIVPPPSLPISIETQARDERYVLQFAI